jgi:hypothetical protein
MPQNVHQRRLSSLARHVAPPISPSSSQGRDDAASEARGEEAAARGGRSLLATALSFPLALTAIALEDALAARGLWPRLRFPRSPSEIFQDPERFFELLRDNQVPRPDSRALLPPGAALGSFSQLEGQTTEPAKNAVNTGLRLHYHESADSLEQQPQQSQVDVFVKFQCGRELKLYLQALRSAAAPEASHREVQFYQRLAHRVPQRVARPYFADAAAWCNRVCLVLEHLGSMEVVTDWAGGSFEQLRAVAVAVAGMHGKWWGRTAHDEGTDWIPAKQGLDYASFVGGFIRGEPEWYRQIWAALQDYFAAVPVTLVHGDCRLGNMMFPPAPSEVVGAVEGEEPGEQQQQQEVVFSDWEATNVGPALWDIAYLSTLSQGAVERRERQAALLAAYLGALGDAGASMQAEEGLEQLELLQLVLFYVSASVAKNQLWSGHGNTTKDGAAWSVRVAQAVVDLTEGGAARARLARALELPTSHFQQLGAFSREGLAAAQAMAAGGALGAGTALP